MVSGAFGLPGSGKSLWLADLALTALKEKPLKVGGYSLQSIYGQTYDRIYTNFPMDGCYQLDFDTLGKCCYVNCLFLCDEIMMYADSRDFKTFSKELKLFFSQHRKMRCDFIWTSQMYDDCDKKIRGITEKFYYIRRSFFPNVSEVLPIESFFDIKDGQIRSGQEFGRRLNRSYFYRPRLYKNIDSYRIIGSILPTAPAPAEPWLPSDLTAH